MSDRPCCRGRTSRFCPDCGSPTPASNHPLDSLLVHCRRQAVRLSNSEDIPGLTSHHGNRVVASKWQTWADALAEIIGQKDEEERRP